MAKDAELFFHPLGDDGVDGDGEVDFEEAIAGDYDEDGGDEGFRETLDALSPAFWSFSDAAASDNGEDGARYLGSVVGDILETETPDFQLFEDADGAGSDYFGLDVAFDAYDGEGANGLPDSPVGEGLRIVGFDSDSDLEDEGIAGPEIDSAVGDEGDDLGTSLRWDSLRIGEEGRGEEEMVVEEFDWEELDGRLDLLGAVEEDEYAGSEHAEELDDSEIDEDDVGYGGRPLRTWDREFLLAMRGADDSDAAGGDGGPGLMTDIDDVEAAYMEEDPGNASDYEVLFGQFLEHVSPINGSPPAARSVLESLPSVTITEEDVANGNTLCAVCKDEISLEEKVKRLPCSHRFHGNCILPWLRLRNTCPMCRYEFPTDNPEYENWRVRRTDGSGGSSMD